MKLIKFAFASYKKNVKIVGLFAILILFAAPITALASSYFSLGGQFIRFSNVDFDLNLIDFAGTMGFFLISTFLFSIALTLLITVVKSQFAVTQISSAIIEEIDSNYAQVFLFFVAFSVLSLLIGSVFTKAEIPYFIASMLTFLVWMPFVFTPQAIIIGDMNVVEAMVDSAKFVKTKADLAVLWFAVGFVLLSIVAVFEALLYNFVFFMPVVSFVVVTVFVLPFLEVLKTEIYLSKYNIMRASIERGMAVE
ncbi:MAG: hypothetical protein KAS30_05215 [Candidatus Diapherotrites archaeon]|nr:hypothetical protein [Candidatus Diapherotrites archaeon]